jgi:hypothetical protein
MDVHGQAQLSFDKSRSNREAVVADGTNEVSIGYMETALSCRVTRRKMALRGGTTNLPEVENISAIAVTW